MRLLIPVILGFLAGCGQSPKEGDASETKTDTTTTMSMQADTTELNTLSDAEKSEGWQLLFDGKTKAGWHSYNKKGDLQSWKVQDGILVLDVKSDGSHTGDDIVTDDEYENFHLKLDWNISEGGNSGIMFDVKESPKYESDYFTGPEMQVLDNERHSDAKIPKHRAGDLYDLISSSTETAKPPGEWNTAEIIKNKDSLELRLNGPAVVVTKLWDANWKKLVANSKFKQWPDFGTFKKGVIALQDHGNKVSFRNIKIRKL